MPLFGAGLGVLPNVLPTLTKEFVLGHRVCLGPLALALRLLPDSMVGEQILKQKLPFDVQVILFLLSVVIRKLVVEQEAVQVEAYLIVHEDDLILIKGGRCERPSAVLALCLVGIVAGP